MSEDAELAIFDRPSYLTVGDDFMPETRTCCECAQVFYPVRAKQIRCVFCQVASDV